MEKNIIEAKTPTFNILIATIGRNTLENLIESLVTELNENDCLTIVFDGKTKREIKNIHKLKCSVYIYEENEPLKYWGHGIRNKYAPLLKQKDFIMHADDDDTYFPVFNSLRKFCVNKTLYIAKMLKSNTLIPSNKYITIGNIGTPCGIIPFEYNKLSTWGHIMGGDGIFYHNLSKNVPVEFLDIILYNVNNSESHTTIFNNYLKQKKL